MYIIKKEVLPHLPMAKGRYKYNADPGELVNCILCKLKTGIQSTYLPVNSLFSEVALNYKTVFNRFRNWCKVGVWHCCRT
jgi:hypothetical protein